MKIVKKIVKKLTKKSTLKKTNEEIYAGLGKRQKRRQRKELGM